MGLLPSLHLCIPGPRLPERLCGQQGYYTLPDKRAPSSPSTICVLSAPGKYSRYVWVACLVKSVGIRRPALCHCGREEWRRSWDLPTTNDMPWTMKG